MDLFSRVFFPVFSRNINPSSDDLLQITWSYMAEVAPRWRKELKTPLIKAEQEMGAADPRRIQ